MIISRYVITFFLLGFSFGIGPCLASCGPLLVTYIAGTSKDLFKSIRVYLLFSLSRVFIYLILGISIFLFGQIITRYTSGVLLKIFYISGGLFIILIGLLIALGRNIGHKFCAGFSELFLKKYALSSIIFGLIIGALPCAPLISVVSFIGLVAKSWADCLLYTVAFGLGTVVSPLFILALASGLISKIINRNNLFYRLFNLACGLVIIFLGIQLFRRVFLDAQDFLFIR